MDARKPRCASEDRGGSACALPCVPTSCLPSDPTPLYSLTQCLKQHHRSPEESYSIPCGEIHQPWPKQQPVSIVQADPVVTDAWMDVWVGGIVIDATFLCRPRCSPPPGSRASVRSPLRYIFLFEKLKRTLVHSLELFFCQLYCLSIRLELIARVYMGLKAKHPPSFRLPEYIFYCPYI